MMELKQAKDALYDIAKISPTLMGTLCKKVGASTVGDNWARRICEAGCHPMYFADVCSEYADGVLAIPEVHDQLFQTVIRETLDRRARDVAKMEQHANYHTPKEKLGKGTVFNRAWRASYRLGSMLRAGEITKEENDRMVDQLVVWDKGEGEPPEWLTEEFRSGMTDNPLADRKQPPQHEVERTRQTILNVLKETEVNQ